MCITSLGIFGFLTGAYQVHSAKVGTFDTKIETLTHEKSAIDQVVFEQANRIKTLTEVRAVQEQRIQAAGNYKAPRDQAYKAIAEANEEIQKKESEIAQSRQKSIDIDKELAELKISLNTTTDIGSFKFIADALNTSVDTAVQYFIFLLIAVFDPLAVTLVLALNDLTSHRKEQKKEEEQEFLASLQQTQTLRSTQPDVPFLHVPFTIPAMPKVDVKLEPPKLHTTESVEVPDLTESVTVALPAVKFKSDFENDPTFKALTEEQKNLERARRRVITGTNDSVMTS